MPTATKLVSAILFAALAWWIGHMIIPYFPEEQRIGRFREILAAVGFLTGWRFLGRHAGAGWNSAIAFGLGASGILVFWGLLIFSGYEMIRRSMRLSYGGPTEALKDQVQIAIDYFVYLKPPEIWGSLIVGGLALGLIAEMVKRRWP